MALPARLATQARLFGDDLKTSWYFRIWFFLWLFCAVFVFAILIVDGRRSDKAKQHEKWGFFVESAKSIEYPSFAFRTANDEKANQIGSVLCSLDGLLINTQVCADGAPRAACVQFNMAGDYATREKNSLICSLTLNATYDPDKMIAFEILKPANEFGIAWTWIRPTANAWVLLTKNVITNENHETKDYWGRQLVYHSSVYTNTTFQISILMDTFNVFHWVEADWYNGWMAVGDIGGFAFFLLIIHTIIMWFVAICFENNSRWLHQTEGSAAEYQPIK